MRVGRTLPPALVPVPPLQISRGIRGMAKGPAERERFRREIQSRFGVRSCFLLSSGKAALTVALLALKDLRPERDEVLIPAYTCYSVPSAVVRAGLRVRCADTLGDYPAMDPKAFKAVIAERGERLLAVIPTHLFGLPSDMGALRGMTRSRGIALIEDAAQCMGARFRGRFLGTCADAGVFSLGRGKAFGTVEGGILLTDHQDLADRIRRRVHALPEYGPRGMGRLMGYALALCLLARPGLFWLPSAIPSLRLGETLFDPGFPLLRLSPFQAGMARTWEPGLRGLQEARAKRVFFYARHLDSVYLRSFPPDSLPDLVRFPMAVEDLSARKTLLRESLAGGLGIMPGYPDSIDNIDELKEDFRAGAFPSAKRHSRTLVTLPVHPFVRETDMEEILLTLAGATH